MKSVNAGLLGVAFAGTFALGGCSSDGKSDTEFAAKNRDGSISILHAHGAVAADDSTKLGNACWYESTVAKDEEFSFRSLERFNSDQVRLFLFARSSAAPISKFSVDCRQGVAKLKALLPGVDISAVCSAGAIGNTALTIADAPAAFGLQGSDSCAQACTVQPATAFRPASSDSGDLDRSGSQTQQLVLTGDGPTLQILPFLSSILPTVGNVATGIMTANTERAKANANVRMEEVKANANVRREEIRADRDRALSNDDLQKYRDYTGTVKGICEPCRAQATALTREGTTLFGNIFAATLQGSRDFFRDDPGLRPVLTLQASSSGSLGAAAPSRYPDVNLSQFQTVKQKLAEMGANGPSGAKPCPSIPEVFRRR